MLFPEYDIKHIIKVNTMVTAFQKKYSKSYFYGGEIHDFWEFMYVIDGTIGVTINDNVYEVSKGEIIFLKPRQFHKTWSLRGSSPHIYISAFSVSGEKMKELEDAHFTVTGDAYSKLNNVIDFFYEKQKQYPDEDFLTSWNLDEKFLQIGANYTEIFLLSILGNFVPTPQKTIENSEVEIYKRAVTIMTNSLTKHLTIKDIASKCTISVSNLKRIFSKFSSYGVHSYFINMKIIKAIEMLSEDISIAEISDTLGFNNPNYFAVVFKRETGYSPLNYKKKIIYKNKVLNIMPGALKNK